MILYRKGIGTLKNIKHFELQNVINSLPKNWGYEIKITWGSPVDEKYNEYKLKIFRKNEQ